MNSYGSVSRVSEAIYKILRYMNWVSYNDDDDIREPHQRHICDDPLCPLTTPHCEGRLS
jgi:hypothetical protein